MLASVVILTTAPTGVGAATVSLTDLSHDAVRREAEDGMHVLVRDGSATFQLWLPNPQDRAVPLAALVPLDVTAPQRAEAILHFWRLVAGSRFRATPRPTRRIERLITALRALDGRMDGASYRAIAEALFGASRVTSEPWKTAPLRDTVIRLARTGFAMMRGGYRNLLGPRRRD